jgi:hypothetical protein
MSHGTCPTVRVSDGGGRFTIINESDFNADEHELFDAAADSRPAEAVAPEAAAPEAVAPEAVAPNKGTTDWYKAELTAAGVEFGDDAKKMDLKYLYEVMTANDG